MVSNVDIEKGLGKHIGIYPLEKDQIEGASIDLTASEYAFSVKQGCSVIKEGNIVIDPGDTVIVFTNESISLDSHFVGACYNRISFSMKGLLHSSSPLKPNYTGRLSVTFFNASPVEVKVPVGDAIVVIMIHKLNSAATITQGNGKGSRLDLLPSVGIVIQDETIRKAITRYDDRKKLIEAMKESESYKIIEQRRKKKKLKSLILFFSVFVMTGLFFALNIFKSDNYIVRWIYSTMGGIISTVIGGLLLAFFQNQKLRSK